MAGLVEWIRLNWGLLAFVLGLTLAFLLLRSTPTPGIDSAAALERSLQSGQPVVLDFYSNF